MSHEISEILELSILDYLRRKGYSKASQYAVSILSELAREHFTSIIDKLKAHTEDNMRSEANLQDLLHLLESSGQDPLSLTGFMLQEAPEQSSRHLSKAIGDFLGEEDFTAKTFDREIERLRNIKKKKLKSRHPMGFIRCTKDRERLLFMSLPERSSVEFTQAVPELTLVNARIKEMRIEEKRNFELENCKINSVEADKKDQQISRLPRPAKNQEANDFSKESRLLDITSIFDITNSQMFN